MSCAFFESGVQRYEDVSYKQNDFKKITFKIYTHDTT